MKTGLWAVESNPWRKSGKFIKLAGWHPHASVPENDHWDCGGEDLPSILKMKAEPKLVTAYQVMAVDFDEKTQHPHSDPLSPFFAKKSEVKDWMVKEEEIRPKVWRRLKAGDRIKIAERRVDPDQIRKAA